MTMYWTKAYTDRALPNRVLETGFIDHVDAESFALLQWHSGKYWKVELVQVVSTTMEVWQ